MSTLRLFPSKLINHVRIGQPMTCSRCWRALSTEHSTAEDPTDVAVTKGETSVHPKPLVFHRKLEYLDNLNLEVTEPRQAWVENFDGKKTERRGLIELHPGIFSIFPRPDLIAKNIKWQTEYRQVDWRHMPTPQELPGHNLKPWPQKGTGRARHGSMCSPQWIHGGWVHGPRGPHTSFYMLNFFQRVQGLISTFAAKQAQNDLRIVDTLKDFPSDDPDYLLSMVEERKWGPSVLIADTSEIFPKNLSLASESIKHINLMPVFGLNVHSMLKHETLVLTIAALERIEERLLYQWRRTDIRDVLFKFKPPEVAASAPPLYTRDGL